MVFGKFLLSTFIITILGILGSYLYIKKDSKDFFGGYKIGAIVGIGGALIGGFLFDLLFKLPVIKLLQEIPYIKYLLVNPFDINFIASILGIWLFLWIYEYVSKHTERS